MLEALALWVVALAMAAPNLIVFLVTAAEAPTSSERRGTRDQSMGKSKLPPSSGYFAAILAIFGWRGAFV